MRDRVGLVDLTAFSILDVSGPGALDYIQRLAVNQMDVRVGRAVYTPLLNVHGGFKADLTIMRLATDQFRVITGGVVWATLIKNGSLTIFQRMAPFISKSRLLPSVPLVCGDREPETFCRWRQRMIFLTKVFPLRHG